MLAEKLPYLIPYIAAFFISLTVAAIIWRRRKVRGAQTYAGVALAQTFIIIGYIFELASPTLEGKLFWDDFQWIGIMGWAYLIPIFALQLTESEWAKKPVVWWSLAIVPFLLIVSLMTNSLHGGMHQDAWLIAGTPFDSLQYEFTPLVWGFSIYGYLLMIVAFTYLVIKYFQIHRIYRFQIGAVVLGSAVPLVGYAFTLAEVSLSFQRDIAPLTLSIGNLIIFWGLTRQHLFDLIPIARDIVVDNIEDIVIVVDEANRVVDLNRSAKDYFLPEGSSAIGQELNDFFSGFEEFENLEEKLSAEGQAELVMDLDEGKKFFDTRVTKIVDKGHQLGSVLVAHNVTTQKEFEQEILTLNAELEQRVRRRTKALEEAYESTLEGWAKALELRDKETEGHSRRVTELAVQLANKLGLPSEDLTEIRRGALIHDIGKMGIPDEILHKPGSLSSDEWEVMRTHPQIGYDLLAHIPFLESAIKITCAHHERWDGNGYPNQLKGEQIPLFARIFTVIDYWDALVSDRPYRDAWPPEKVFAYMRENRGTIFDPSVLDAFLELMGADS